MSEDFTFETATFPPAVTGDAVAEIAGCVASLSPDATSPFLALAVALPPAELTDAEVAHARALLQHVPAFAEARHRLVPQRVSDERFWAAYFTLLAVDVRHRARQALNDADAQAFTRVVLRMPLPPAVAAAREKRSAFGNFVRSFVSDLTQSDNTSGSSSSSSAADARAHGGAGQHGGVGGAPHVVLPASLCIAQRSDVGSCSGAATLLVGRDTMTTRVRAEWRKTLNDMCGPE